MQVTNLRVTNVTEDLKAIEMWMSMSSLKLTGSKLEILVLRHHTSLKKILPLCHFFLFHQNKSQEPCLYLATDHILNTTKTTSGGRDPSKFDYGNVLYIAQISSY